MQLIINKKGAKLGIREGRYRLRVGEEAQYVAPAKVRSILLQPGTSITHEAVRMAVTQETEILFVDETGFPFARLWSHRYGSVSTIRKNQVAFGQGPAGLDWIKGLLARKLENQTVILALLQPDDVTQLPEIQQAAAQIEHYRGRILGVEGEGTGTVAGTLRGLEGSSGRVYFQTLGRCLPPLYQFDGRSQRPARDMFNALLNYAYGMLYGTVEGALIQAGLDPYLGVLHRDEHNRPVLVYDMIEPYRVWAEYVVVRLCLDQVMFEEFFEVQQGGYWLNGQGKRVLIHAMNDYLDETIEMSGEKQPRRRHILREAQALAQRLK
ncbi:MAG: CRISPR-associated endonuclease Cas1 [Bacteroidetes bacterium]|nr:MAG: CRISPR-associated endonuclease Cas1 [Bacteroidota bacterium]